ncbi:MAG: hypothetical protein AAF564_00260 [Bacteroidota bacterium]
MNRMKTTSCLALLALLFIAIPVSAQEVDFDVPTEINIIQGRLSVVFNEGIGAADAEVLMKSLGYPILQKHFYEWTSRAHADQMLTEEEVRDIKAQAGVVNVSQTALDNVHSTNAPDDSGSLGYLVIVTFASHITRQAAADILEPFSAFDFTAVASPPNEVIIEVGDKDDVAMAVLQNQEQVRWVTYVGIGSGG